MLTFSNAALVKHSFSNKQDIADIQKALDEIRLSKAAAGADTIAAFDGAQRLLNRERKQTMSRVLVVASNGRYGSKEKALSGFFLSYR